MTASIEEIRSEWQQLNRRVEGLVRVNAQLVRRLHLDPGARRFSLLTSVGILFVSLMLVVTGHWIAVSWGDLSLLIFPVSLHVMLIAQLIHQIWLLNRHGSIDWQRPVLELQREVLHLRRVAHRMALAWLIFWLMMHVPMLLWGIEAKSGYDPYLDPLDLIDDAWMASQSVFAVAIGLGVYWVLRYHRDHPWVVAVLRESAGIGINALLKQLEELQEFGREQQP